MNTEQMPSEQALIELLSKRDDEEALKAWSRRVLPMFTMLTGQKGTTTDQIYNRAYRLLRKITRNITKSGLSKEEAVEYLRDVDMRIASMQVVEIEVKLTQELLEKIRGLLI